MSHVDEGTLHAYADGAFAGETAERDRIEAHLGGCEDCRTRLADVERLRDRAADVLRGASPDHVRVEPFETMLAARRRRAAGEPAAVPEPPVSGEAPPSGEGGAGGRPSRSRRWNVPLAWAATLMLAVTAAWFARANLPGPVTEPSAELAVTSEEGAGRLQEPPEPPEPQAAAGRAAAQRDAAAVPPSSPPPVDRVMPRSETAERSRVGNVASPAAQSRVVSDPDAVADRRPLPAETRQLADQMVARGTPTPAAEAKAEVEQAAAKRVATETDTLLRALASFADVGWQTVAAADAERTLGRPPAAIPDLAVDSLQAATVMGRAAIRVVQRIDARTFIELVQWPMPAGTDEIRYREGRLRQDNPPAGGRDEANERPAHVLRLPGVEVVVRARLTPDSLAVLAGRVR